MANILGVYDPLFYANEALIWLQRSLGMAVRVHRGFDKAPQQKGSTIMLRRPASFQVQDAPSTAQDLATETDSITLDQWKEVKFQLSDKELTYTGQQIIDEHIRPAAYALANYVDQTLQDLYKDIPWYTGTAGTTPNAVSNITTVRKRLSQNLVPFADPTALHLCIDPEAESEFLALPAFSQWQGQGETGAMTQMTGSLGRKFGLEVFASQNVKQHVKGTASVTALAVNGATLKGAKVINLDAGSVTGTLVKGDSFVIAGNTQRYVVTSTVTAAGNAFGNVAIFPALVADVADNAAVTVTLQDGTRNMAFHRDAFALAVAPLSTAGDGLGARIATAQDPQTGLALRSRVWYSGDNSSIRVALDILYGVKTLNPNLAAAMLG